MFMPPHPIEAAGPREKTARRAEVLDRLATVSDPELDESVVEMGFVNEVEIAGANVEVEFRLPTFWCAANFAFLMAEDIKVAVEALPWVECVTVRLVDHFAAERINRGVAEGAPFEAVFAGEASEGIAEVRETFRRKAYLGRQETLLDLIASGGRSEAALALTVADLQRLARQDDGETARAAARYLAARRHFGGPASPGAPAFTTIDGASVAARDLPDHRREARRVLRAARANAEMCRLYLKARYDGETSVETLEKSLRSNSHE